MATNRNDDEYESVKFYADASKGRKSGFESFTHGDKHYFALITNGEVALRSQAYVSVAGRDNGIASVKKNMVNEKRYRFSENAGRHGFGLFAGNGQEIAISGDYATHGEAETMARRMNKNVKASSTKKAAPAKAATKKPAPKKAAVKKAAPAKKASVSTAKTKSTHTEDNYRSVSYYENRRGDVVNGFSSFGTDGDYYFAYFEKSKLVWRSESYETAAARDNGIASVKKNMPDESKIKTVTLPGGRRYLSLRAGNHKEIARSGWIKTAKKAVKKSAKPIAAAALATGAVAAAKPKAKAAPQPKPKPKSKDDDYLPCKEYHGHAVNDKVNNVAFFKHSDGQFYFAIYDESGDVRLRSEGFVTAKERDSELSGALRLKDDPKYYKRIEKGEYFMDVLYDETGREVGRSCLRKKAAPIVAAAPIAAAAPVAAASAAPAAAAAPVAAKAAAPAAGMSWGWLKWLLLALLALLALFLLSKCLPKAVPPAPVPVATPVACWNGSTADDEASCPDKVECWDGSFKTALGQCPKEPAPVEETPVVEEVPEPVVTPAAPDPAPEPVDPIVLGSIDRFCGPSSVTLFDVPNYTPKPVTYLGSNPQFGDSHGLTPTQFYDRLAQRASYAGSDRAFLNYMARSLGYGSFRDMDASMFSNATLNRGEKGMLGFSPNHALQYSVLNTEARDLEAFRVLAANGQDVHFMKTCGNFMYVCQ